MPRCAPIFHCHNLPSVVHQLEQCYDASVQCTLQPVYCNPAVCTMCPNGGLGPRQMHLVTTISPRGRRSRFSHDYSFLCTQRLTLMVGITLALFLFNKTPPCTPRVWSLPRAAHGISTTTTEPNRYAMATFWRLSDSRCTVR